MFCCFEITLHLTFYSNNNKVFNKTDNKSELLYPTQYYLNISKCIREPYTFFSRQCKFPQRLCGVHYANSDAAAS